MVSCRTLGPSPCEKIATSAWISGSSVPRGGVYVAWPMPTASCSGVPAASTEVSVAAFVLIQARARSAFAVTPVRTGSCDERVDRFRRALEDRFDPAVGQVAHPARHAVLLGQAAAGVAEEDALDPAGDEHPIAHHKPKVRRPGSAA